MKKFSVLVALALLALAGTGYAVTCAYDNVPGATLLIPYFRVGGAAAAGGSGGYVPATAGTDTLISIVNTSTPGVIAHVTVWNKYSKAVLDFNVPLTGKDVASFSMRDILNGKLNVNKLQHDIYVTRTSGALDAYDTLDACGVNIVRGVYKGYFPDVGWGQQQFIRFSHPEAATGAGDFQVSISSYDEPDAFAGFRARVLDSLDESADLTSFTSAGALGGGILDVNNPACTGATGTLALTGDFSGYVTVDVVNFCTNYFPDQAQYYTEDAIATAGWALANNGPNVLMGDVFYVDGKIDGSGNISGDPAISLEFDSRLNWIDGIAARVKTFYGRNVWYRAFTGSGAIVSETLGGATGNQPAAFVFGSDGREPLGERYGFRYLNDPNPAFPLRTWIEIWRSDLTREAATYDGSLSPPYASYAPVQNICDWAMGYTINSVIAGQTYNVPPGASSTGYRDSAHKLVVVTYDNDEQTFQPSNPGGPSGGGGGTSVTLYAMLEAARYSLLGQTQIIPDQTFKGGWIDMTLHGTAGAGAGVDLFYDQAWVGVQHSGPGATLSVGHSATLLNEQFLCNPAIFIEPGMVP